MSVPDQLARMGPEELQRLRARAAVDQGADPVVKQRLERHIRQAAANLAAKN